MLHIYQKKKDIHEQHTKKNHSSGTLHLYICSALSKQSVLVVPYSSSPSSASQIHKLLPPPRQSPLDIIRPCSAGEYAQINQNGLVCTSASDTTAPVCEEELNCCRAQEFVKITPDGLTCVPIAQTHLPVCGRSYQKPCSACPPGGCCPPYTFASITTEGLKCVGAPIWVTRTIYIREKFHGPSFNLFNQTSAIRVLGAQPITLSIVERPQGPGCPTVSIQGGNTLSIGNGRVSCNKTGTNRVSIRATNTVAGITNNAVGSFNVLVLGACKRDVN